MNRFDQKYNSILNEFFGGLASAAGSFLKAGQDPSYLFNRKTNNKKDKSTFDIKNKPKVGKLAVYANNTEVIGRVVKPINNEGQFGISLIKPNGQRSDYEFVKTEKKPYWRIDYIETIDRNHIDGKDVILKQKDSNGNNISQISPTDEIPYVMVGKNTKFESWISYDEYIKRSKNN